ncbi:sigma-70 family RNA polymerase sigma factor [Lachnospiraceae bacterium 29-84]
MTNEQIVSEIRNGFSTTNNMQLLYESNLPLIKKFIKPYTAYECETDLLQESYFGLLEAVKRYETDRNVQFMTFAQYWIKQSVQRYLEKCGFAVRIPSNMRAKMSRLRKATSHLRQERGREPVPTEIAALLGVSMEEVQEIQGYMQSVVSLDTPIAEDNSLTLADTLQADLSVENDTIDKIYSEHSKNELWDIVECYTATRENEIIREIFLHGKTMAAVAREQGLSFDRIRQIKESGLRRLRMGKARSELLEKFDIAEAGLFRGGLTSYKEHNFTSIVEHLAEKRLEAETR